MTIFVKPIRPRKKWSPHVREIYYATLLSHIKEFGEKVIKDYYKIKRTWNNRPRHEKEVQCSPAYKDIAIMFGVTGDEEAVKHWHFLNEGTSIRHALMSKDWKSKTKVKHIGSSEGAGHVVFISRKIRRPGITARKFDDAISERWTPRWKKLIMQAMKEARKAAGL